MWYYIHCSGTHNCGIGIPITGDASILSKLRHSGAISKEQYWQLYPTSEDVSNIKFYGSPKIHKQGTLLCPIIQALVPTLKILLSFVPGLFLP